MNRILLAGLLLLAGCTRGPTFDADASDCDIRHPSFTEQARTTCLATLQQGGAPFSTINFSGGPDASGKRAILLLQTDKPIESVTASDGAETAHTRHVAMVVMGPGAAGREVTLTMEDGEVRNCLSSIRVNWSCS